MSYFLPFCIRASLLSDIWSNLRTCETGRSGRKEDLKAGEGDGDKMDPSSRMRTGVITQSRGFRIGRCWKGLRGNPYCLKAPRSGCC